MPYNVQFGIGIRRLLDAQQSYMRNSFPFYLRIKNFADTQPQTWSQLGFAIAPTGTPNTGVTDIPIKPPPYIRMVSQRNILMSEGKLRFGARVIHISGTFVDAQVRAQGITGATWEQKQNLVWRAPSVVGLVSEGLLFSIEDIAHEELAGQTINWLLTCNAGEIR